MISFFVHGTPQPQGSMVKPWRQQIAGTAAAIMSELGISIGDRESAYLVEIHFRFPKPPSTPKRQVNKTTNPRSPP